MYLLSNGYVNIDKEYVLIQYLTNLLLICYIMVSVTNIIFFKLLFKIIHFVQQTKVDLKHVETKIC